jgi:hypothetical protein
VAWGLVTLQRQGRFERPSIVRPEARFSWPIRRSHCLTTSAASARSSAPIPAAGGAMCQHRRALPQQQDNKQGPARPCPPKSRGVEPSRRLACCLISVAVFFCPVVLGKNPTVRSKRCQPCLQSAYRVPGSRPRTRPLAPVLIARALQTALVGRELGLHCQVGETSPAE